MTNTSSVACFMLCSPAKTKKQSWSLGAENGVLEKKKISNVTNMTSFYASNTKTIN